MMTDDYTDSLFAADVEAEGVGDEWLDLRLIHESERGWCAIYTCLHRGHRIVVKSLQERFRNSELHRRLLEKEYAIGHGMNHANVATIMWMEEVPGPGLSILMEYVDGVTLGEYLASHPRLRAEEQLHIVEQICSAVSYLHSRQVVHCDLKPSNVMVTHDGRYVKLIDFGASRGFGYEKLDFAGGTRGFTAPENLQSEGGEISSRTDVYSIGRLIGLMDERGLFGRVVQRCTSQEPARRPAHVAEIPQMMRASLGRRRLWRMVIVGVMSVAVVGGVIAWLLAGRGAGETPVGEVGGDSVKMARPSEPTDDSLAFEDISALTPGALDENRSQPEVDNSSSAASVASEDRVAALDATEDIATEDLPLDAQLYRLALQAAGRRFRDHINMIDTMTTVRTRQLVGVNHWRWLAKQDVRRWLESKLLPGNPRVETLLADAEKAIKDYGDDENRKGLEYQHYQRAIKRKPSLAGVVLVNRRVDYEKDRYYVDSLLEDGTWYRAAGNLTPRPNPKDFGWF